MKRGLPVAAAISLAGLLALRSLTVRAEHRGIDIADHIEKLEDATKTLPTRTKDELRAQLWDLKFDPDKRMPAVAVKTLNEQTLATIERVINDTNVPLVVTKAGLTSSVAGAQPFADALGLSGRARIMEIQKSVGMIERRRPDGTFEQIGTGFVGHQQKIITNCHVILRIARQSGDAWRIDSSDLFVDFGVGDDHSESDHFRLLSVGQYEAQAGFDVGLLEADVQSVDKTTTLPADLTSRDVRGNSPYVGEAIAVIGYPALSGYRADPNHLTDPMGKVAVATGGKIAKVMSPGVTKGVDSHLGFDVLLHTASTYSGQSGSPVVDVNSGEFIGVHSCCTAEARPGTVFSPQPLACAAIMFAPHDNESISSWAFTTLGVPRMTRLFPVQQPSHVAARQRRGWSE